MLTCDIKPVAHPGGVALTFYLSPRIGGIIRAVLDQKELLGQLADGLGSH